MPHFFTPSGGPSGWRTLLASPDTQWVRTKSAFELAVAWEAAGDSKRGLPQEVAACLDSHPLTEGASLVLGLPELKVPLPGGNRSSQTDLWALLSSANGLISAAVEGKSGEPFDRLVGEWRKDAHADSGKSVRLAALQEHLGLSGQNVDGIRYQLLHRTASALIQAARFRAPTAVLIIHAFGGAADAASFQDFTTFCSAMDAPLSGPGTLSRVGRPTACPLLVGWVGAPPATDAAVARTVATAGA